MPTPPQFPSHLPDLSQLGKPTLANAAVAGLAIQVAAAVGRGPSRRAAYDHALLQLGVANFNLVPMSSSMIPLGATMQVWKDPAESLVMKLNVTDPTHQLWGQRLNCAYAVQYLGPGSLLAGAAGLGWLQVTDATQSRWFGGLLVEHIATSPHGEPRAEKDVHQQIRESLNAMVENRGMPTPDKLHVLVKTAGGSSKLHTAIVVFAAYALQAW